MEDLPLVGGKNASLGEMIGALSTHRIPVPDGFAVTAKAYRDFLAANNLEQCIQDWLEKYHDGRASLRETGQRIRRLFLKASMPESIAGEICRHYAELGGKASPADPRIEPPAAAMPPKRMAMGTITSGL